MRWYDEQREEREKYQIVIENRSNEGNGCQEWCVREGGMNEWRNEYDEYKVI